MLFDQLQLNLVPSLPPCVGAYGGTERIAIGLLIVHPELGEGVSLELPPNFLRAYHQHPRPQGDPVGNLLSRNPLENAAAFFSAWMQGRSVNELLNDDRYVRGIFRVLAPVQLVRMLKAVENHRGELGYLLNLEPRKRKKKIRPAIHTLFRCQTRPLDAKLFVAEDADTQLDSAIAEVRKRHRERFVGDAFPLSPRATQVTERGRVTVAEILSRETGLTVGEVRAYLTAAEKDYDPVEDELMAYAQREYARVEGGRISKKPQAQSKEAPLMMGSRCCLTQVDIEVVANAARERTSNAVRLIALIIGLALPAKMIFRIKLKQVGQDWWEASHRIAPTHRAPKIGKGVLESRENLVVRYLPRAAVDLIRSLPRGKKGRIRLDHEAENFLQGLSSEYTVARLEEALFIHGSAWYPEISWLLLNSAKRPGDSMNTKQDAARSYSWLPHKKATCLLLLLDLVAIPYSGMPPLRPGGWGSARCPKLHEMKNLFGQFDVLCESPISKDLLAAVLRMNAVTSLAHSGFLIYSGLRNYPMQPPSKDLLVAGEADWIRQKGLPSLVYIPGPCRQFLLRASAYWEKWKKWVRQFYPSILILEDDYCYRFVSLRSNSNHLRLERSARHALAIQGFIGEPKLRRWASLPATSFRSFTNSLLRGLGRDEMSIRDFHHHSYSPLHYTRIHRQEPALKPEDREEIASLLAGALGHE